MKRKILFTLCLFLIGVLSAGTVLLLWWLYSVHVAVCNTLPNLQWNRINQVLLIGTHNFQIPKHCTVFKETSLHGDHPSHLLHGVFDLVIAPYNVDVDLVIPLLRLNGLLIVMVKHGRVVPYTDKLEQDDQMSTPTLKVFRLRYAPDVGSERKIQTGKMVWITYSSDSHLDLQMKNRDWARSTFRPDAIITYSPDDLDPTFRHHNREILSLKRGGGYWIWKPYFIYHTLRRCNAEFVVYCDSSTMFRLSRDQVMQRFYREPSKSMMAFELWDCCYEYQWNKADCYESVLRSDTDRDRVLRSYQICATASVYRQINSRPLEFTADWLRFAQLPNLVTDAPSSRKNEIGFIEHRHDQSVSSCLYKDRYLTDTIVVDIHVGIDHHHFG